MKIGSTKPVVLNFNLIKEGTNMVKTQKGFTLIELVIVIVILGILAAVAIPRYVNLTTQARTAAVMAGLGGVKSAWGIDIGRKLGVLPTLTELVERVDGGVVSGVVGLTVADIFAADGVTLYIYNTYTDAACATATTAVGDLVACIRCQSGAVCTP